MKYRFALAFVLNAMLGAVALHAADVKQIEALLKREVISPELAVSEVQKFCDDRVPRMERYQTAAEWQAAADRMRARGARQGHLPR